MPAKCYINFILLSQFHINRACDILGAHHAMISVIVRAVAAMIGRRDIYLLDRKLL